MDLTLVSAVIGLPAIFAGLNHLLDWEGTKAYAASQLESVAGPANALAAAALTFGGAATLVGYDLGNYVLATFLVGAGVVYHRGKEEVGNLIKNLIAAGGVFAAAGTDLISSLPDWIV